MLPGYRAYEILWAFRATNAIYKATHAVRATQLATQLSRRAVRETTEDELSSFARWVAKVPFPIHSGHYGYAKPHFLMDLNEYLL